MKAPSSFCLRLVMSFFVAASCSLSGSPAASQIREKIIDGTLVPASTFANVTLVDLGTALCSGTLVAPNFVLTAGHCFFDEATNERAVGDNEVIVTFNGRNYFSKKVYINPSYINRQAACIDGEFDAALVELTETVSGVTPAALQKTPLPLGAQLTIVGYGTQGSGAGGEDDTLPPDGYVNYGTVWLDSYDGDYIRWTFYQGQHGSNTASGDSGGPAFYNQGNGQLTLAGITCGGTGNSEWGTQSWDTRADLIATWIESIVDSAPGSNGGTSSKYQLQKATLKFQSVDSARNVLDIKGKITLGANFNPRGKLAKIIIGGFSKIVKLNATGKFSGKYDRVTLTGRMRNRKFIQSKIDFEFVIRNPNLFYALYDVGMPISSEVSNGETYVLPVYLAIGGVDTSQTAKLKYRATLKRWDKSN